MISSVAFLFLPLAGAISHLVLKKHFRVASNIANLLLGALLVLSLFSLLNVGVIERSGFLLFVEGPVRFDLQLFYDQLTQVMVLLISLIGLVVHQYASRYLYSDEHCSRFMAQLCLLIFSVLLLVMSANLLTAFLGWQCIGFTLYWLLNHYHYDSQANRAAKKKFIINRLGDTCFLLAVVLCFQFYATTEFKVLLSSSPVILSIFHITISSRTLILSLIFIAVMTKSAQFPFHIWLPDTMQTPTPVSAIMHAGVINAGGFLLVRLSSGLIASPGLLVFIALIGFLTLLFGSVFADFQFDSKKQLAYSTMSQMGYMILQCGLGCFFGALFHLIMHGFFKAFSFLNIGNSLFLAEKNLGKPRASWFLNVAIAFLMLCVLLSTNSQFFKEMMLYPLLVFFMFITLSSSVAYTQTECITWRHKLFFWMILIVLAFFYLRLLNLFQLQVNHFSFLLSSPLNFRLQILLIVFCLLAKLMFSYHQSTRLFSKKFLARLTYFTNNKFFVEEFYRCYGLQFIRTLGDIFYHKFGYKRLCVILFFSLVLALFLLTVMSHEIKNLMVLVSLLFLVISLLIANRATTLGNMIVYLILSQYFLSCLALALPGEISQNLAYYQLINTSFLATMFSYILMKIKKPSILLPHKKNNLSCLSVYLVTGLFSLIALPITPTFISEIFIMKQLVNTYYFGVLIFVVTMILLAIAVLHVLQEYVFNFSMARQFAIKLSVRDHFFCLAIISFNVINGIFPLFFMNMISRGAGLL